MKLPLYRLLSPLIFLTALLAMPFSHKLRCGFLGRVGLLRRIRQYRLSKPLWFHFSSAGEFEQVLSVIDAIHSLRPEIPVFLSYFSPSAQSAIERETERRKGLIPWSASDFAPFDLRGSVCRFFDALRPRTLVIVNRELWPELTVGAKKRNIPLALIASFFWQHRNRSTLGPALPLFDWIGTVDEGSKTYLNSLGAKRVTVMGDPRIERILNRKTSTPKPWSTFFQGQVLVMGSLWPEDFLQLQSALPQLAKNGWRLIFVPHEPTERFVKALCHFGKTLGGVRRWSNFLKSPDDHSHLAIDSVGVLADLYSVATIAFVGGGFKSRVHNVAEPAVYRIPILTGPKIFNSAEAVEFQRRGALTVIHSGKDTLKGVETAIAERDKIVQTLDDFFKASIGVAQTYATAIIGPAT